jgi:TetR/AcrR family transcriptional regulator, transcriptional repressor for nem operon
MRIVLQRGTARIIERLARVIAEGLADGSLAPPKDPDGLATLLYHLWLGASLRAKMTRDRVPLDAAYRSTLALLGVAEPVSA